MPQGYFFCSSCDTAGGGGGGGVYKKSRCSPIVCHRFMGRNDSRCHCNPSRSHIFEPLSSCVIPNTTAGCMKDSGVGVSRPSDPTISVNRLHAAYISVSKNALLLHNQHHHPHNDGFGLSNGSLPLYFGFTWTGSCADGFSLLDASKVTSSQRQPSLSQELWEQNSQVERAFLEHASDG